QVAQVGPVVVALGGHVVGDEVPDRPERDVGQRRVWDLRDDDLPGRAGGGDLVRREEGELAGGAVARGGQRERHRPGHGDLLGRRAVVEGEGTGGGGVAAGRVAGGLGCRLPAVDRVLVELDLHARDVAELVGEPVDRRLVLVAG